MLINKYLDRAIRGGFMNRSSGQGIVFRFFAALVAFLTASAALALPCFLCRKPILDTPISLAVGTVRTPKFFVKHEIYTISIQVERKAAPANLSCMIGVKRFPWVQDHCETLHADPLLEADWTLWDSEHAVAHGTVSGIDSNFTSTKDVITRQIGTFVGEKDKQYILELRVTKDGTPLNVTHPHLIVMMTKPTDI